MKKLSISVIPHTKEDKKQAKLMEKVLNYEYEKNKEFITAIARAKVYLHAVYGIEPEEQPWEMILEAYIKAIMRNKLEDK